MNRRIRNRNVSAREILTGRDQITNKSLNITDEDMSRKQLEVRNYNHPISARSKAGTDKLAEITEVWPGALVFIKQEKSKLRIRETYIVVKLLEDQSCLIKKLENQCRDKNYKVKLTEIELLPNQVDQKEREEDTGQSEGPVDDHSDEKEAVIDTMIPLKTRAGSRKYELRNKMRPDYKLMSEGPYLSRILTSVPPKYGWDTPEEATSSDEGDQITNEGFDDEIKEEKDSEFDSPLRSWEWDNYQSPPSFSTATSDQARAGVDLDNRDGYGADIDEEDESTQSDGVFADATESEPAEFEMNRRSKRVRKPYPYRGISEFIANYDDDFANIVEEESVAPQFRPNRTLTGRLEVGRNCAERKCCKEQENEKKCTHGRNGFPATFIKNIELYFSFTAP